MKGIRNVRFSENLACFVFLKYPFWDSPFCLINLLPYYFFTPRNTFFMNTCFEVHIYTFASQCSKVLLHSIFNLLSQVQITLIKFTRIASQPAFNCSKLTVETLEQRCETCSKLTIKTPKRRQWRCSGIFIVNFEHISDLCSSVSIVNFEHVIAGWVRTAVMWEVYSEDLSSNFARNIK